MLTVESEDTRIDNRCVPSLLSFSARASRHFVFSRARARCAFVRNALVESSAQRATTDETIPPPRLARRAIKDERVKEGKIDTSELDEWLTQLDGAPGPAPEEQAQQ